MPGFEGRLCPMKDGDIMEWVRAVGGRNSGGAVVDSRERPRGPSVDRLGGASVRPAVEGAEK